MRGEFFVTVDGPRGETWERVLGTGRLAVLSPVPVLVDLRDAGRGVDPCFLLDVQALTAGQRRRLVDHIAERFERARGEVWEEVLAKGVPVLAEGCSKAGYRQSFKENAMDSVTLRPAHVWDCPCGETNYCTGDIAELSPEERAEMIEDGIDPDQAKTGEWLTAPAVVTCAGCGAEYATERV